MAEKVQKSISQTFKSSLLYDISQSYSRDRADDSFNCLLFQIQHITQTLHFNPSITAARTELGCGVPSSIVSSPKNCPSPQAATSVSCSCPSTPSSFLLPSKLPLSTIHRHALTSPCLTNHQLLYKHSSLARSASWFLSSLSSLLKISIFFKAVSIVLLLWADEALEIRLQRLRSSVYSVEGFLLRTLIVLGWLYRRASYPNQSPCRQCFRILGQLLGDVVQPQSQPRSTKYRVHPSSPYLITTVFAYTVSSGIESIKLLVSWSSSPRKMKESFKRRRIRVFDYSDFLKIGWENYEGLSDGVQTSADMAFLGFRDRRFFSESILSSLSESEFCFEWMRA